ncbi:hypothetical protein, partial [Enterococcus malodoratus]
WSRIESLLQWNAGRINQVDVLDERLVPLTTPITYELFKDAVRKMNSKYKGAYKVPTLGGLQEITDIT